MMKLKKVIIMVLISPIAFLSCTGYNTIYKSGSKKKNETIFRDSLRVRVKYKNDEKLGNWPSRYDGAWGYITTQDDETICVYGHRLFGKKKTVIISKSKIYTLAEFSKMKGEWKSVLVGIPIIAGGIIAVIIFLSNIGGLGGGIY